MDLSDATAIFLKLKPRYLRAILPLILTIPRKVRVLTYLVPFPNSVRFPENVVVHPLMVPTKVDNKNFYYPIYLYKMEGVPIVDVDKGNGVRNVAREEGETTESFMLGNDLSTYEEDDVCACITCSKLLSYL